jgi:transposase-like protein
VSALSDVMESALALAEYRMRVCKDVLPCPECGAEQVQLLDTLDRPVTHWRCRVCHFEWDRVQE